jgi:hypothetical protein
MYKSFGENSGSQDKYSLAIHRFLKHLKAIFGCIKPSDSVSEFCGHWLTIGFGNVLFGALFNDELRRNATWLTVLHTRAPTSA